MVCIFLLHQIGTSPTRFNTVL
ncbi:hypothetical protein LINGRAHAP2_LOCUS23089 [Linum grandiflorum]